MDIREAIRLFIQVKHTEGLRKRSIDNYQKHLNYFVDWLVQNGRSTGMLDISKQDIRDFVAWSVSDKKQYDGHPYSPKEPTVGLSHQTVNGRLRSIKVFLNFCVQEEILTYSPARFVKKLRDTWENVEALTVSECKALIAAPDRKTFAGFRDYVLICLLLDTGMRVNEAVTLTFHSIDFERREITISGEVAKNRTARIVPISDRTAKLLKQLRSKNKKIHQSLPNVFITQFQRPMKASGFYERLKEYGSLAGITRVSVHPHMLRHTVGMQWVRNGGDAMTLQKILGHKHIIMTQRYVKLHNPDVSDKHRKYSPLNRMLEDDKG